MNFDLSCVTVKTEALTLVYSRVPLDEEVFSACIASIDAIEVRDPAAAARDSRPFTEWRDAMRVMLCTARVPQNCIDESMLLEELGFRFIELAYTPYLDDLQDMRFQCNEVEIVPAHQGDRQMLTALAEQTFQTGRFHQDPRIDTAAANRRYGQWLWRAFDNPRQNVLKIVCDDRVIGFFVVESPASTARFWNLIGLGPQFTGRGLGTKTWTAMLRYHQAEGVQRIATAISSQNIAVMNLYIKLGFRFPEPQITLHWRPKGSEILGR